MIRTTVFPPRDLGSCPRLAGAGPAPLGLHLLGAAGPRPGRQRHALGLHGRVPHRAVALADRAGDHDALGPPAAAPGEGVVERSQGTSYRWCEPWTCATPEELQSRLERMDRLHREVYPYRERLSRMDYFRD